MFSMVCWVGYTGTLAVFRGGTELTQLWGTSIEAVQNLTDDLGRVFTEKIPPGIFWYVPYRTYPSCFSWDFVLALL